MKKSHLILVAVVGTAILVCPSLAFATVETTLNNFGNYLTGKLLPIVAILGLAFAGFSFITGNPNAKNHLFYAIIGVGVGLGAKSIVDAVRQLVQ